MDPDQWGVSFSIRQCRDLGVDWRQCLAWALEQGWRRFRLMSYWNECEPYPGEYDFTALDEQFEQIERAGGVVTLCLGVKQPRWPEYHWPGWVQDLPPAEQTQMLMRFIETVVRHCRERPNIVSYQLENEALLRGFGEHIQIDRPRLRAEFALVRRLDPKRPIIMSTSNSWGIPLRAPMPDIVGFSYYAVIYSHGAYHRTPHMAWLHRLRAWWLRVIEHRQSFIHELQLEPWGPRAIWEMQPTEQDKSMGAAQITRNIHAAKAIGLTPIDLWGLEWWFARSQAGDDSPWRAVKKALDS